MSAADEIKARLDIVDYIQRYVPLKRAGKNYKAPCPFHAEKTASFMVSPDRQSWHCFGQCSTGGDVITFAMKQHGWSFSEALQELGKLTGVEVKRQTPEQRAQVERLDVLRGLLQAAADAYHERLLDASDSGAVAILHYAHDKRGLSDETINQFNLGYAMPGWNHMLDYLKQLGYSEDQIIETGMAVRNDEGRVYDRFRNRLMIPIRDDRGRVIGFGARALDPNDNPKYLNSPQTPLFDKSHTLFGLDSGKSAVRDSETVVIVEGYMDAIQAQQAGFKNVVAQMGTALTEIQLKLVTRTAKKIILALDSDAAGQSATLRSLETARTTLQADYSGRLKVDIRVLQIPGAKDPDDLIRETPERWAELVANALPVADYVMDVEMAGLPPNATVQEREAVARRLLPILLASEDNLYKKDNLQKLALKLRIAESDLLAWADEQIRIERARKPARSAPQGARRDVPLPGEATLSTDQPPDFPPVDYDQIEPPPADGKDVPLTVVTVRPAARTKPLQDDAPMEAYCLRMLFRKPEAYYTVNRRVREVVEKNMDKRHVAHYRQALLDGPLTDWGESDFRNNDAQVLMQLFLEGLNQYNMGALDYVRDNAGEELETQLEALLADDLIGVKKRLRAEQSADLTLVWNNNRRYIEAIDADEELAEKALRLRVGRLQREQKELGFLQIDSQMSGDSEAELQFGQHIWLSNVARGLIETELQKLTSALRE
jgi:DNA primase